MPSGYHELETVMQSIDIFDIVTLRAVKGSGRISVFAKEGKQRADFALPQPRNTAYRAAELLPLHIPMRSQKTACVWWIAILKWN